VQSQTGKYRLITIMWQTMQLLMASYAS